VKGEEEQAAGYDRGPINFCCGEPSVAFRSAKVAINLRSFRSAKGDDPANILFPRQKLINDNCKRQNAK
jgi:hypothetical protein